MRGGLGQFAGALQLDAPKIQAARIKSAGQSGVGIGFARDVEMHASSRSPQTSRGVRVGRRGGAFDGRKRRARRLRPESFVFGDQIFVRSGGSSVSSGSVFNL